MGHFLKRKLKHFGDNDVLLSGNYVPQIIELQQHYFLAIFILFYFIYFLMDFLKLYKIVNLTNKMCPVTLKLSRNYNRSLIQILRSYVNLFKRY